MQSPYEKGRAFEYRVRKGFDVVRQAKSAFPDLIALKNREVLLVECRIDGEISRDERLQLVNLAVRMDGRAAVAHRNGRKLILKYIWNTRQNK